MTHYKFTNGTKFNVDGNDFTLVDLREVETMFQSDVSYYGNKRTIMITADGMGDRQDFTNAVEVANGDICWLDGALFHIVVVDPKASNGVKFITDETFKAVKGVQDGK